MDHNRFGHHGRLPFVTMQRKAGCEFRNVLLPNANQSRIRALTAPTVEGGGNPPCYWSSVRPDLQEKMSEEHSSAETSELARLRALVADYETKLTDAAALVARVRHEINNPLAGLLGQAQLLLREELSDKARARVLVIEEMAKRIEKIGSELRDVQMPVAVVNRAEE
jgi:signal transduction histidine kinase